MKCPSLSRVWYRAVLLAVAVPACQLTAQKTAPPSPAKPAAVRPVSADAQDVAYVRVLGVDYAFTSPDVAPAGIVAFNLVNAGSDLHALAVFELPANHSLREFLDQYHAQGMIPAWMIGMGQTTTIAPKSETFLTLRMKPGRYILACLIPARDGRMHTEKGMVKMLTVR